MHTKATKVYALNVIGYEGATPDFRFAFTAVNDEAAESKAFGWVRYHGYSRNDITVTVANAEQAQYIRNEYVS